MKIGHYNHYMSMSRRNLLKGVASAAVLAGSTRFSPAFAQSDLRTQLMQIPGVGNGQPGEPEWNKVGELCMGPTKANVQEGEFKGVELTFMGLNSLGYNNIMFRGFLKSWEEYTGAKINWIDLTNSELNTRVVQSIALNSVDYDIVQMGPAFEGDTAGRGVLSEMPDWVAKQIEIDDYVDYLKAPVGTWKGKTYGIRLDGDAHNLNYRTDVFSDSGLAELWAAESEKAGLETWGVPSTLQQVNLVTKFLKGKQLDGQELYGYLDALKPWGGFGFYFVLNRCTPYAKHPDQKAWLFDIDTMKPRINNPAFVRGIQDIVDCLPYEPADQLTMDGVGIGFSQFLAGTGSMINWWADIGSNARTSDSSVIGDVLGFAVSPGSDDVYNAETGQWEVLPSGPNVSPMMAHLGLGLYVTKHAESDPVKLKAAWSCAAFLGGKDISLWTSAYPSALQPYRNSHFNVQEWVVAGYDEAYIGSYLSAIEQTYNHPNAAIEARIPGAFTYYSLAEDELAKVWAGQMTAQEGADAVAAAWEKQTDQLGRESQIQLYKESLGL